MRGPTVCLMLLAILLTPACLSAQQEAPTLIPESWSRQVVITVPPARPEPPRIDGHVTGKEWYYASSVGGFIDVDTGCLSDLPVRSYWCYDDEFVYVGIVIHRPPMHPTPRATFAAGQHPHIWWKDDSFELVIRPGRPENGVNHFYAFCGNSVGAWSNMRGPLDARGGDTSWPGQWVYKATRAGRESWHAELAIPIEQFPECERPSPGAVWFADLMNQQVTPAKKMIDLGLIWGFQGGGYRSENMARLVFVDEGPILRPHGLGRLRLSRDQEQETMGLRQVFYNQGQQACALEGEAQLFRAPAKRPAGTLSFFDLWDRLRAVQETGKPVLEPGQDIQAFRSAEDLLKELNERYQFVAERRDTFTVLPGGAGYFNLERPVENGEYLIAYRFTDPETGEVLSAQVVPYAILPALDLALRPYFLKHDKLRAEASLTNLALGDGDRLEFALEAEGEALATATASVTPDAQAVHAYLNTGKLQPETEATVTARLIGADGVERISNSATITRPPVPAWFGNDIGRSKVVPPPFEPVRTVGENAVEVWQRRIELGDNGLPRSIIARGTELLAGPIRLDLGAIEPSWKLRRVSADERDAVFEAEGQAGGLRLKLRTAIHYDGTARFDLQLDPGERAATLDRLVLEVPVAAEWARLATHHATWTDPQRAQTTFFAGSVAEWFEKYAEGAMPFTCACYLGAEDRGLQWFAESDRGWANQDEEKVVSLVREQDATVLRIAMVDEPVELRETWATTFGLTVTPVKDTSLGRSILRAAEGRPWKKQVSPEERAKFYEAYRDAGINEVSSYMCDDNHFGCPRMYNPENERLVRDYVRLVHENGFCIRPYSGWGANANIPDFATFGQEMLAEPIKNIGWGCFLHSHAGPFADWWLDGVKYTIEQSGFDGIYMDSTCMPRLLQNELDGFAWTDAEGHPRGTYPIWAVRDFIERLYVYTHVEAPKPATVRNHYNVEVYCIGAFCDQRVTGEAHYHAGETILEVASPSEFRAFFMTHPNGVATTGLWWNYLNLPLARNEMRAMFLLHDLPMVVGGGIVRYYRNAAGYGRKTRPWVRLRKIRAAFDGAEFVPYWGEVQVATCEPEGPLASAWVDRERGRALIVLSNLATESWDGAVRFDREALGIGAASQPFDAMFDRPLQQNADGSLPLSIEPQRYRLVIFGGRIPLPDNPALDETADTGP